MAEGDLTLNSDAFEFLFHAGASTKIPAEKVVFLGSPAAVGLSKVPNTLRTERRKIFEHRALCGDVMADAEGESGGKQKERKIRNA